MTSYKAQLEEYLKREGKEKAFYTTASTDPFIIVILVGRSAYIGDKAEEREKAEENAAKKALERLFSKVGDVDDILLNWISGDYAKIISTFKLEDSKKTMCLLANALFDKSYLEKFSDSQKFMFSKFIEYDSPMNFDRLLVIGNSYINHRQVMHWVNILPDVNEIDYKLRSRSEISKIMETNELKKYFHYMKQGTYNRQLADMLYAFVGALCLLSPDTVDIIFDFVKLY